jgi:hypothetical protein
LEIKIQKFSCISGLRYFSILAVLALSFSTQPGIFYAIPFVASRILHILGSNPNVQLLTTKRCKSQLPACHLTPIPRLQFVPSSKNLSLPSYPTATSSLLAYI